MRRAGLALAAFIVMLAFLAVPGGSHAAAQDATVQLSLVSQTLWMEPPGDLTVVLEPQGELPDDAVVTLTVHARTDPPISGFERAVQGDVPRIILGLFRTVAADIPRDDAGRLVLTVPVDVLGGTREGAVVLAEEGLYPIRVSVRGPAGDDLTDPMILFLLRTGEGTAARPPLAVATVLPVSSGPTLQPGSTTVTVEPEARDRASLVADTLAAVPDAPLTAAVRPELMDALGQTGLPGDAVIRDHLATSLGKRPVTSATYTDVDPSALLEVDLGPELTAGLRTGEDALAATLPDARSERNSWVSQSGIDEAGLASLRDLGFRNVVLPLSALAGEVDPTGAGEIAVGNDGTRVRAIPVDPVLTALMEPEGDVVLAAYQLLARLTAAWLELVAPDGDRHGTALLPRAGWQPNPVFLGTLLKGLQDLPATDPVTLDDLFDEVDAPADPADAPLVLAPYAPQNLGVGFAQRLSAIRFDQASVASMVPPATPQLAQVDLLVQMSLSRGLDAPTRTAYLQSAGNLLAPFGDGVEVVMPSTITLAGRTSEIPITVNNSLPYPVTIRLQLSSPKLVFPDGDPVLTVEDSVQLRVPVEARANGTFELEATAVTPEGDMAVSSTSRATVRVTAVAGLGLALSVGAILVLVTWWAHHARATRRKRRLAGADESAARHPANGSRPRPAAAEGPSAEAPTSPVPTVDTASATRDTAEQPVVPPAPAEDTAEHPVVGP